MIDLDHLHRVKENYFVHLVYALRLAVGLLFLSCICVIHALVPVIFVNTASKQIEDLNTRLKER